MIAFAGADHGSIFPLPIFPESGLSESIITTVLVGLLVVVFFNETFGWVLSGMVVPGYLGPVLVIQPWSGTVIVVEALATHVLVRFTSDHLARLGLWRGFFGRDRGFAYLLFGVAVRAVGEGFLFHRLGEALNSSFGLSIDYRNSFYSIGLIVVPLLANTFWKPGIARGLLPAAATIGLTYAAIRYVLIPYTNFSISSFELAYGYYATSFLGNAKAYIILLTSAYLASRANLRYGWDYNGILMPSLLALAWFTPLKVVTSLLEAVLVLHVARFIASRKALETVTIEGGRKVVLCFAVGFALKEALGFYIASAYPGFRATDIYGFGYLMPSLIAGKMWQKGSVGLVIRPLVQTSLVGMLAGSLACKVFMIALPVGPGLSPLPESGLALPSDLVKAHEGDLYAEIQKDKARIVRRHDRKGVDRIYGGELDRFREALGLVRAAADAGDPGSETARQRLLAAAALLRPLGYAVVRHTDPAGHEGGAALPEGATRGEYYVVREVANAPGALHGWGIFVFDARPRSDLVLEVPRPLAERKSVEAGAALFQRVAARALLVAGAHPEASRDGSADVLAAPGTTFQAAHELFRSSAIVQVRGEPDPAEAAYADASRRPHPGPLPGGVGESAPVTLYLENELPEGLSLPELAAVGGGEPRIVLPGRGRYERKNVQRDASPRSFATLVVSGDAVRRLVGQHFRGGRLASEADVVHIDGYLLNWIDREKEAIAPSHSEKYRPPD